MAKNGLYPIDLDPHFFGYHDYSFLGFLKQVILGKLGFLMLH